MIETIYLEECKEKHWECKNLSDVVGDSTDLVSRPCAGRKKGIGNEQNCQRPEFLAPK